MALWLALVNLRDVRANQIVGLTLLELWRVPLDISLEGDPLPKCNEAENQATTFGP